MGLHILKKFVEKWLGARAILGSENVEHSISKVVKLVHQLSLVGSLDVEIRANLLHLLHFGVGRVAEDFLGVGYHQGFAAKQFHLTQILPSLLGKLLPAILLCDLGSFVECTLPFVVNFQITSLADALVALSAKKPSVSFLALLAVLLVGLIAVLRLARVCRCLHVSLFLISQFREK